MRGRGAIGTTHSDVLGELGALLDSANGTSTPEAGSGALRTIVRLLVSLVVIGAGLAAIIAATGFAAYQVETIGDYGRCRVFSPEPCTDIPLSTLESLTEVHFPPGTVVTSSSAQPTPFFSYQVALDATLRLPLGEGSPLESAWMTAQHSGLKRYSVAHKDLHCYFTEHSNKRGHLVISVHIIGRQDA